MTYRELVNHIKTYFSMNRCYKTMELKGKAAFECCDGTFDDDGNAEPHCVECAYFVDVERSN